jgi:hypothetical protein
MPLSSFCSPEVPVWSLSPGLPQGPPQAAGSAQRAARAGPLRGVSRTRPGTGGGIKPSLKRHCKFDHPTRPSTNACCSCLGTGEQPLHHQLTHHRSTHQGPTPTVKEVGVVLRGQPVEVEDAAEVVELAVRVAADRDMTVGRYVHVHKWRQRLEQRLRLQDDLRSMQGVGAGGPWAPKRRTLGVGQKSRRMVGAESPRPPAGKATMYAACHMPGTWKA